MQIGSSERDRKLMVWKGRYTIRKYCRRDKVISEPASPTGWVPMCRIRLVGSSVRLSGCMEIVKKC